MAGSPGSSPVALARGRSGRPNHLLRNRTRGAASVFGVRSPARPRSGTADDAPARRPVSSDPQRQRRTDPPSFLATPCSCCLCGESPLLIRAEGTDHLIDIAHALLLESPRELIEQSLGGSRVV